MKMPTMFLCKHKIKKVDSIDKESVNFTNKGTWMMEKKELMIMV